MNDIRFIEMEKEVIRLILQENSKWSYLLQDNFMITKREFTGVGFYTDFYKKVIKIRKFENARISTVGGILNEKIQVGFVLFIEEGQLDVLEGYTYDEPWPEKITAYKIFEN